MTIYNVTNLTKNIIQTSNDLELQKPLWSNKNLGIILVIIAVFIVVAVIGMVIYDVDGKTIQFGLKYLWSPVAIVFAGWLRFNYNTYKIDLMKIVLDPTIIDKVKEVNKLA